jgi:hypothetical protein
MRGLNSHHQASPTGEVIMAKAKQFNIPVADEPGSAARAVKALGAGKVNILSILAWNPSGMVQIVTDNPKKAAKALAAARIDFSESAAEMAVLPNKPGTLVAYLEKLAKKGVNLRSVVATTAKSAKKAVLVWTAETR